MLALPDTLSAFFAFVGTPVFAAFVVSEVLEHLKAFQALSEQGKVAVVLALSIVLGILSFGLVHWVPASVIEQAQPIYAIIVGTVAAFLSGQIYHSTAHGTSVQLSSMEFSLGGPNGDGSAAILTQKADVKVPLTGSPALPTGEQTSLPATPYDTQKAAPPLDPELMTVFQQMIDKALMKQAAEAVG